MADQTIDAQIAEMIETTLIRDIVERHPEVMPVLAGYGMDLCCGGGHTIVEAARLHGIDAALLSKQVEAAIAVRARG